MVQLLNWTYLDVGQNKLLVIHKQLSVIRWNEVIRCSDDCSKYEWYFHYTVCGIQAIHSPVKSTNRFPHRVSKTSLEWYTPFSLPRKSTGYFRNLLALKIKIKIFFFYNRSLFFFWKERNLTMYSTHFIYGYMVLDIW